jgi:hypothetical protein
MKAWLAGRRHLAAPCALLLAALILFARRAKHGMRYPLFGDESMHFVGAQVLNHGGILYRDFVEVHGPLAYALPQLYGAVFGWAEPLHARIIPLLLALAAGGAITCSAALRGAGERITALAIFLGLISSVWLVQSLCLYDYQMPAGALLLICAAVFTVPSWLDCPIGRPARFAAGFCAALAPFIAFSYGPAALLFLASGAAAAWSHGRARTLRMVLAGAVLAVVLMLAWMVRYADFRGFLAFSIIHAIVDFGPYLHLHPASVLTILWQPRRPDNVAQAIGEIASLAALLAFAISLAVTMRSWRTIPPLALGVAGLIMTNPRASAGFQNGGFMIAAFGLAALALAALPRHLRPAAGPATRVAWIAGMAVCIAGVEAAARQASTSPHGYFRKQLKHVPPASLAQSDAPWAEKVRLAADPGEPMLVVPFEPNRYLLAGRPPMNRYVYYLPWDADYTRHPWLGIQHDLCADVQRNPPPVIYDNGWTVWAEYDPAKYMACLTPILAKYYRPMPGEPHFYVRADRAARLEK